MSTHRIRLHGRSTGQGPILPSMRALERGWLRLRRGRSGKGEPRRGPSADGPRAAEGGMAGGAHRPEREHAAYWIGDERETTQGDW